MKQRQSNILFLTVSIVYLFFNSFLLPDGLLYTTLLTPFFFIYMLRHRGWKQYAGFLLVTVLLAVLQYPQVAFFKEYVKSFILLQCVAVFVINTYYVIQERTDLAQVFKTLGTANLLLLGVSIVFLMIPVLRSSMWYEMSISEGIAPIPRLKMFTYEASYYSLLIMPLFSWYFLKKALLNGRTGVLLLTLTLSLLLSFSLGVLTGIIVSIILLYLFNFNELGRRMNLNYFFIGFVLLLIILALAILLFPHNIVFERLRNIYEGKDTSARGRTYESFNIAWNVAKMKSVWWGIGPGQLKLIGRDYIIQYYTYTNIPEVIRIPNAVAETLNIYGIVGLVLRFGLTGYLFVRKRVWTNYFRLLLFLFIFIYQFTGSFLVNVAEYVIWILAFSPLLFPAFDRKHFIRKTA